MGFNCHVTSDDPMSRKEIAKICADPILSICVMGITGNVMFGPGILWIVINGFRGLQDEKFKENRKESSPPFGLKWKSNSWVFLRCFSFEISRNDYYRIVNFRSQINGSRLYPFCYNFRPCW